MMHRCADPTILRTNPPPPPPPPPPLLKTESTLLYLSHNNKHPPPSTKHLDRAQSLNGPDFQNSLSHVLTVVCPIKHTDRLLFLHSMESNIAGRWL
jgi:hypothetical protein